MQTVEDLEVPVKINMCMNEQDVTEYRVRQNVQKRKQNSLK